MLLASNQQFKLLKVVVEYEEQSEAFSDQYDDDDDDIGVWSVLVDKVYFVIAPTHYTNGELIDHITSYLESVLEHEDANIVENTFAIKTVEFMTATDRTKVLLLTEMRSNHIS